MRTDKRVNRGFTLIELLVVIAIIAILAAILFPIFFQSKRNALTAKCSSHLRQCTQAWLRYVDDNNGRTAPIASGRSLPFPPWWETILPWKNTPWKTGILAPYLKSAGIANCPEYQQGQGLYYVGTYGYNYFYLNWGGRMKTWTMANASKSDVTISLIQIPSKTICFIDCLDMAATPPKTPQPPPNGSPSERVPLGARHNNGWNVGFCDGHVKWYTAQPGNPIGKDNYFWALDKTKY
ncbi:MAG: prepilin-type N-terminal cleavage/methylation domain-containing protein [Armatimonadetes bacterium]|nr:prepilin-type N-terminal cleavage/methylation domain-containing protein [Armatimonadota bacterium]